jgi:glycosyltransferase involved in cell wall biosynthesis
MRTVLFYNDFRSLRGSQLKIWHYFNHVRSSGSHVARICFSDETVWDASNPWRELKDDAVALRDSIRADALFLSGWDWEMLDRHWREDSSVPVINLIQALKHAQPGDRRYPFLQRKAIRICVSPEVETAIRETRQVNGPVFVIPNGIDLREFPSARQHSAKDVDLLIVAAKQPEMGRTLREHLDRSDRRIELLTTRRARPDFLNDLNRAKVTIFLPKHEEGFFLPALEGMALNTLVVCPDCVGNRSFCLPGDNCLRPDFALEKILNAAETVLGLSAAQTGRMLNSARETVARHSLECERKAFLQILENMDGLW